MHVFGDTSRVRICDKSVLRFHSRDDPITVVLSDLPPPVSCITTERRRPSFTSITRRAGEYAGVDVAEDASRVVRTAQ